MGLPIIRGDDKNKDLRVAEIEFIVINAIQRYVEVLPVIHNDEIDTALSHILYERMKTRKN
jgi:hypothetical protein